MLLMLSDIDKEPTIDIVLFLLLILVPSTIPVKSKLRPVLFYATEYAKLRTNY